ncbi:tetratricopeptide repeat protein [Terriglobus roseus DSM 18391]|uniref:Tetratricopeptide repeat protein n=1 Tax=Terriglobus roseus (strain DSM 18391 / NRRL B-41598 / KBS 63) TaxID=926566 RepID=I3ZJI3_TERRK|nr:tetratricopeptide repeat protein [Terriglobus roseus]AFL89401.1 tetratricopeptide repeat protein [Terriglobus roseus DSM 18391]
MRQWIAKNPLLSFCVVAMVWVSLLYSAVINAPFLDDDIGLIANNTILLSWHEVWTKYVLSPLPLGLGLAIKGEGTYRPMFLILLAIEKHVFGDQPGGFHFTGLFLHWINGVLLFELLRRLRMRSLFAALASLIWLGMPINSEAVVWGSAQSYPLCLMFLLSALLLGLGFVRSGGSGWLVAFTIAALLADFSYEQGLLLVVLVGLGYILLNEQRPWHRWGLLAGAGLLAATAYFACRWAVGTRAGKGPHHFWNVAEVFWHYLKLIVLPVHMSIERSTSVPGTALSSGAVFAWAALIFLIAGMVLLRQRIPALTAGLAVVLITLLPYYGFVYIYQGMAERYVYFASIGFAAGLAGAVAGVRPAARRIVVACLVIWMGWGAWRLVGRVDDWQSALALYGHSLEATPNSALTNLNYGVALQLAGRQAEAEDAYRRVITLAPMNAQAHVDLENLYIVEGRLDEAIAMYKRAIAIDPNDVAAYFNLGVMFQERGQDQEALVFYKKVLQLKPDDPQTLLYLTKLLKPRGNQ